MKRKSVFASRLLVAGLVTAIACSSLIPADKAYADRRRPPIRRPPVRRHYSRPIRPLLPLGFVLLTIAGIEYYYHRGIYYRPVPYGYKITRPPVGTVVMQLPLEHITFRSDGVQYYYYNSVYYNKASSGYIVVNPPSKAVGSKRITIYQPPSTVNERVKVACHRLNVRSGPGKEHKALYQVPLETVLEVHGTAPGWYFVKLPSGEFGWVMEKFTLCEALPADG